MDGFSEDDFKGGLCQRCKPKIQHMYAFVRLSVGFPGQKAACRLGKQPSKCMCSTLGSQPTTRPLQAADFGSPLPKVNKCAVFTSPPTCYGNLSAINLKGIIVLYYILPRAEGDRFAQASKHVPRVGRGRCAAFFFSPACCLPRT
jgi:hypothetical protein